VGDSGVVDSQARSVSTLSASVRRSSVLGDVHLSLLRRRAALSAVSIALRNREEQNQKQIGDYRWKPTELVPTRRPRCVKLLDLNRAVSPDGRE